MSELSAIPAHIPAHLVRPIDVFHLDGGDKDPFPALAKIKSELPDVFYTPRNGGHWILNRAEYIKKALQEPLVFSSARGTTVPDMPEGTPAFPPLHFDPPVHRFFRQPFNVALSPQKVLALAARAREVVIEQLDTFADKGRCEFTHEMAMHVPVAIVMQIFDLPFEDREFLIPLVETLSHSPDLEARGQAMAGVAGYAARWVYKRAEAPAEDLISKLLQTKIDDRMITVDEVIATVTVLILGGLDTVSHSMAYIMRYLAENPAHRRELAANPELIPTAIDELLRRHSIAAVARTLTQDVMLGDALLKPGDKVLLMFSLQNLDPEEFENPLEVDFHRKRKENGAFGGGVHRCVGINLARSEIRALLEEWLKRIPEFSIDPDSEVVTMNGQTMAVAQLPLVWPVAR